MTAELYEVLEAIVAKPGDILVIRTTANITPEQAARLRERTLAHLPSLGGVAVVALEAPESDPIEIVPLEAKRRP